jgi:hypothetical protein
LEEVAAGEAVAGGDGTASSQFKHTNTGLWLSA